MFALERSQLRAFFYDVRDKVASGVALEPLERMVADVIAAHPEYHEQLADRARAERDYSPEDGGVNPFLHMAMHVAIAEQLASDRPPGVRDAYLKLRGMYADTHELEHAMMECLGRVLWEAQRGATAPDEQAYLECVRRLRRSRR